MAQIGNRFVQPLQQILDPTGVPYVGAKAFFYATGTSTFQNTYADVRCTVPNANPILTNSGGFWPNIFMIQAPAYRVRVEDPTGTVVYDVDPVSGVPTTGFGSYVPGFVPAGMIAPFAGGTPPAGWLFCDGSAVSRTVFGVLFSAIGTTFGPGDGATTFNLPDLRGRAVIGKDDQGGVSAGRVTAGNSGLNATVLGAGGGNELIHGHFHGIVDAAHTHEDTGHSHTVNPPAISYPHLVGNIYGVGVGGTPYDFDYTTVAVGHATIKEAATGLTQTTSSGNGNSQNVQPSIVTLYIIFGG